ncbi:MAG: DUF2909 domain-containing protein [Oceanicoccus sp.]|uniref:DUF2909 domain-containing protein n=1 Tax=Oceanicoccus sp. TaxID=2691044 RepID=UPI00262B6903|nr:DUF2909 domain-containing protein [Oceanicoccus sp.]MCP3909134.1 DUF2909 domain-containing protein [Oceanicoccus sp.]MDG1773403.1 DUF2909 domain-containing protein [Oceanicoccus sp.]
MWLKVVIVFLFIALVISLFTSLGFLIKDQSAGNNDNSRYTWNALTVRIVLAFLLLSFIFFGVFTGKLGSNAPWDARYSEKITPVTK